MSGKTSARGQAGSDNTNEKGIGGDALVEKVPIYNKRTGDKYIHGDNNTHIILGRDRTRSYGTAIAGVESGYGGKGYHNAGAIDIVVGMDAPTHVRITEADLDDDGVADSVLKDKGTRNPVFTIAKDDRLTKVSLLGKSPSGQPLKRSKYVMDAARIYISQKTDIDHAFDIVAGLQNPSPDPIDHPKNRDKKEKDCSPRSAIGMKADEIRLYSRQGIKLVTGNEPVNSVGGNIAAVYGIDLIAGNKSGLQEPLVKGFKLAKALRELVKMISDITGIVSTLFQIQFGYNIAVGTHWHPEPVLLGMPGIPSPVLATSAMPILITEIMSKLITSLVNMEINLGGYVVNYLTIANEQYINSSFNSTN